MTDSTWNAYDGRMTTPLLRCAPWQRPADAATAKTTNTRDGEPEAVPRSRSWPKNPGHLRTNSATGSGEILPYVKIPLVANAHPLQVNPGVGFLRHI